MTLFCFVLILFYVVGEVLRSGCKRGDPLPLILLPVPVWTLLPCVLILSSQISHPQDPRGAWAEPLSWHSMGGLGNTPFGGNPLHGAVALVLQMASPTVTVAPYFLLEEMEVHTYGIGYVQDAVVLFWWNSIVFEVFLASIILGHCVWALMFLLQSLIKYISQFPY